MPRPPTAPKLGLGLGLNARQRGSFQQAAQQGAGGSAQWLATHPGVQQQIANSPGGGMQGQRIQNFLQTGQNQRPQPPVGRPNFQLQQPQQPMSLGMAGGNMAGQFPQPQQTMDFQMPQQNFGFGGGPGYSLGGQPPPGMGTGFDGGGMGGWGGGNPYQQQMFGGAGDFQNYMQQKQGGMGGGGLWQQQPSGMIQHGSPNPFGVNPGMQQVIQNRLNSPAPMGGNVGMRGLPTGQTGGGDRYGNQLGGFGRMMY